jgi:hypothetical protein
MTRGALIESRRRSNFHRMGATSLEPTDEKRPRKAAFPV